MAQNGVYVGPHRPNYTSSLSEYILQSILPPIEAGEISNNDSLRIKYFLCSLIKNAFMWFTMLPANSIHVWTRLERLFNEQLYMGQSKISLKELSNVRRKFSEPVNDYWNRYHFLKARCFTQVPEHELVEMAVGGLDYSIRKKLDTQYLRDMAQ